MRNLAGGHNFLVMGPDGEGANIEAMPGSTQVTKVSREPFVHTNHCLDDETRHEESERAAELVVSSQTRLERGTSSAFDLDGFLRRAFDRPPDDRAHMLLPPAGRLSCIPPSAAWRRSGVFPVTAPGRPSNCERSHDRQSPGRHGAVRWSTSSSPAFRWRIPMTCFRRPTSGPTPRSSPRATSWPWSTGSPVGMGAGIYLDFDFANPQHTITEITGDHQCGNHDPDGRVVLRDGHDGPPRVSGPGHREDALRRAKGLREARRGSGGSSPVGRCPGTSTTSRDVDPRVRREGRRRRDDRPHPDLPDVTGLRGAGHARELHRGRVRRRVGGAHRVGEPGLLVIERNECGGSTP